MWTAILTLSLVAAGTLLAALFYLRRGSHRAASFFLAMRAALLCALLLAFFEPVITFDRLDTGPKPVCVLVDASLSMRLFHPERTVIPFLKSLDSLASSHGGPAFRFYCFGDSLRRCADPAAIRFSDAQSFLPLSTNDPALRSASLAVVISDGNFSNVSPNISVLKDKACCYVGLPRISARPFVQTELVNVRESTPLDSTAVATMRVSGFVPRRLSLDVSCRMQGVVVSRKAVVADSGYFSDTVSAALRTNRVGRFVYSVLACDGADTVRSVLYFSQCVVPRRFVGALYCASPVLDRRFVTSALTSDGQWAITAGKDGRCDAVFLFDYCDTMAAHVRSMNPKGVAVFLGEVPCAGGSELSLESFSLAAANPSDTLFDQVCAADLAPPSAIQVCPAPFLAQSRTLLFCRIAAGRIGPPLATRFRFS